jgi:hypothetical protein
VTPGYVAALVAVLIDGVFVPSAPPAVLVAGHVVGPVELVARFTSSVEVRRGNVTARRDDTTCSARSLTLGDPVLVELTPLARCLGAHVTWDGRSKTLSLAFPNAVTIKPLPSYVPLAPQASPSTVFTPQPAPPTPRPIEVGSPRPRRTAIPVAPSWPVPSTVPSP